MQVKAQLNNLRISPRKVRLVTNLIKGLPIASARAQLRFLVKRSSQPIMKLLDSAVANAKNNFKIDESNLYISEMIVNAGPVLKRIMPRAMGRAAHIHKRTTKILMVLDEKVKSKKEAKESEEAKDEKKTAKKAVNKTAKKSVKKVTSKKSK